MEISNGVKPLIVANWKCNPQTWAEARKILKSSKPEIVICPPFPFISKIQNAQIGAQDCFWENAGAFTGEVSCQMLKNFGCQYVILGHSERRQIFKETDEMINKKIRAALAAKLKPILCCDKIQQIKAGLKGISKNNIKKVILAYEPIFAIGTGKPCPIAKAKKMSDLIRQKAPGKVKILYGGSVKANNACDHLKKAGFDGLLIGSASLNPKEFGRIIKEVEKL